MKKIILFMLLIGNPLLAKNSYYLILRNQITPQQFDSMKERIILDVGIKWEINKWYVYNNPDPKLATRVIVECDDSIEDKAEMSIFIIGKLVKKIAESEVVVENGKLVNKMKWLIDYKLDLSNPDWWNSSLIDSKEIRK